MRVAGVDSAAPGPELAGMLANVPVEQVANGDVVELMQAAYQQATHYRALFRQLVREVGLRLPGPDDQVCRGREVDEFAADEVAAALVWSRTRAQTTLGLAIEVCDRLPEIGAAMVVGQLDEPRAKAFCDWTAGLSDEHSTAVVVEVLPQAAELTVGQLCEAIKRTAVALDPSWAQRRYEESVQRRRVVLAQTPEGTACLSGQELPADRAVAGHTRIGTLARRCKQAGDRRAIDLIRADLYLGLLDGALHGMNNEQIIAHVLAHPLAGDPTSDRDVPEDDQLNQPDDAAETGEPTEPGAHSWLGDRPDSELGGGPDDVEPDCGGSSGGPNDRGPVASRPAAPEQQVPEPAAPEPAVPEPSLPEPTVSGLATGASAAQAVPAELRVRVGTLHGVNEYPGELPGFGYIPTATARDLMRRMVGGKWRYVICDEAGLPIDSGSVRSRPALPGISSGRTPRGGLVELQLTTAELDTLRIAAAGSFAAWAGLLDEITARNTSGSGDTSQLGAGGSNGGLRVAGCRLRRWVQVRDRTCVFPGCRAPSTQVDQDHRIDYAAGGTTCMENLQSLRRHHHRLKHEGSWQLDRSDELTWYWTSRLGRRYRAQPPPVMPRPPEPCADGDPGHINLPTITPGASGRRADRDMAGRSSERCAATDGATAGNRTAATNGAKTSNRSAVIDWDQPGPLARQIQATLAAIDGAKLKRGPLPDNPPF